MATATPTSSSPNPNALKFELDTTLATSFNFTSPSEAEGDPFASRVFAVDGVVSVFGVNDFVTVNRREGAEWEPIVEAVQAAAAELL